MYVAFTWSQDVYIMSRAVWELASLLALVPSLLATVHLYSWFHDVYSFHPFTFHLLMYVWCMCVYVHVCHGTGVGEGQWTVCRRVCSLLHEIQEPNWGLKRASLCSTDQSLNLWASFLKHWDYRLVLPYPLYVVLRVDPRASSFILSTLPTEPYCPSFLKALPSLALEFIFNTDLYAWDSISYSLV